MMDHCHHLPHVSEGLVAHPMHDVVTTPYVVGGDVDNQPERPSRAVAHLPYGREPLRLGARELPAGR